MGERFEVMDVDEIENNGRIGRFSVLLWDNTTDVMDSATVSFSRRDGVVLVSLGDMMDESAEVFVTSDPNLRADFIEALNYQRDLNNAKD